MGYDGENALHAMSLRPWMVFDIETCPMPDCAEYLTDPIEAPSNYKDPAKIAAYVDQKRQQQIDEAGLDLDLCEVVAIGGAFHDATWVQSRETRSEEEMLRDFWRFAASTVSQNGVLVGFNELSFDLPVLFRRSLYLGIETPRISIDRYRHDSVVDLAEVLSYGRREWLRSLSFYAKRFGIACDDQVDGSRIARLVADGNWQAVRDHCAKDVATTRDLALRCGLIRMPLDVEGVAV